MGCSIAKRNYVCKSLPIYNMLVAGFHGSGKTSIINCLKGVQPSKQQKSQLQITTFNVNNQFKILAFEVTGKAHLTWHHFYSTAKIIMMVIDITQKNHNEKIRLKLKQMDNSLVENSMIFIVLNKCDLLNSDRQNETIPNNTSVSSINQQKVYNQLEINSIQIINQLNLDQLNHNVFTFRCSGKTGIGIKNIFKKLSAVI